MSVPPRPTHAVSRYQQLRDRLEAGRQALRMRRRSQQGAAFDEHNSLAIGHPHDPVVDVSGLRSLLPGIIAGALVAIAALAGIWGWQTWSGRVSEPIDDRLPLLVATDQPADDGSSETPTPVGVSDTTATLPPTNELLDPSMTQVASAPSATSRMVVHVAGAVARPGVVELQAGARVVDALIAAGDASAHADLDRVNLAALVVDGERIHVPSIGEDTPPIVVAPSRVAPGAPGTSETAATIEILDINIATADALEALPGVGPSIAQAIVQTRLNRGPFLAIDELLDVPGIGEAKLLQIEPFVRLGP